MFYQHCPSAKDEPETVADIIAELKGHTLTVCLAALSLSASGMEPKELLQEYESLILEHEGDNTFDYAICQLDKGIIALS